MTDTGYLVVVGGLVTGLVLAGGGISHLRYPDLVSHLIGSPVPRPVLASVSMAVGLVELGVGVGLALASLGIMDARWPYRFGILL